MKLFVPTAVVFTLAGFLVAQEPVIPERLDQLRRDMPLIEVLVGQGIQLADESEPLNKARSFQELTKTLVANIRDAADHGQEVRTQRLGSLLQTTLESGVAENLASARQQIENDPTKTKELRRLGEQVLEITQPLDPTLERPPTSEHKLLQAAGKTVQPARIAIRKILNPTR